MRTITYQTVVIHFSPFTIGHPLCSVNPSESEKVIHKNKNKFYGGGEKYFYDSSTVHSSRLYIFVSKKSGQSRLWVNENISFCKCGCSSDLRCLYFSKQSISLLIKLSYKKNFIYSKKHLSNLTIQNGSSHSTRSMMRGSVAGSVAMGP